MIIAKQGEHVGMVHQWDPDSQYSVPEMDIRDVHGPGRIPCGRLEGD